MFRRARAMLSARFAPMLCLFAGLALVGLSGCEGIQHNRGNIPDQELVSEIQKGVHRREDVAALIGSPSSIGTFDDRRWYYIGQDKEQMAFFAPEVRRQEVLVVEFDQQGTVTDIKRRDLADARSVDPVGRETPTAGHSLTFFEQLFGNVGRFNKDDAPGN